MVWQKISDTIASRRIFPGICILGCALLFSLTCGGPAFTAKAGEGKVPQEVDSYTLTQRSEKYRVSISYPSTNNSVANAELAIWAREQVSKFTEGVEQIPMPPPPLPYELFITYETVAASPNILSVIFFISTAMGGAHPEPGMATFIYDNRDGRRLSYGDIFLDQNRFTAVLSERCRAALSQKLQDRAVPSMLEAGTGPDIANFDLFSLTPTGLRIHFPPYQAAPYSEGYLTVDIPLGELEEFKPQLSFWDKK